MLRKLALALCAAVLAVGFAGAPPAQAKDPRKHYYKAQEKRAKAYHKFQRKQAKEYYKFCHKYGC